MRTKPMIFGLIALGVALVAFYFYFQNRAPVGIVSMSDGGDRIAVASLVTSVVSMFASAGCFIVALFELRAKRK